jgi:hypothetical protein
VAGARAAGGDGVMLPDERMVEAAILVPRSQGGEDLARHTLKAAFAALDRDALIEAGAKAVHEVDHPSRPWAEVREHDQWLAVSRYRRSEAVLRAVGLIS